MEEEYKFVTDEGYEYLIVFQEYTNYSSLFGISVIDVSIILMNEDIEQNSYKSLIEFINIINDFLNRNKNVVLYYYCDISPVKMRQNRKQEFSPQEFRNNLFTTMFNKSKSEKFILQQIIVNDEEIGNHYASLITGKANENKLEDIIEEVESLFRK